MHVGGGKRSKLAPLDRAGAPRAGKRAAASAAHDRVPIDRTEEQNDVQRLPIHEEQTQEANQNPYGQDNE